MSQNIIYTAGAITTIALADEAWAIQGLAKTLCGHDNFEPNFGAPDEQVIDSYCAGKVPLYGTENPGTLTANFSNYDPRDEGQKLVNEAPRNSKMLYTVEFENGDKVVYRVIKKSKIKEQPALSNINIRGTLEMGLVGEGEWTLKP